MRNLKNQIAAAIKPVAHAIQDRIGLRILYEDNNWTPDSQVELTLTIEECQDILNLYRRISERKE